MAFQTFWLSWLHTWVLSTPEGCSSLPSGKGIVLDKCGPASENEHRSWEGPYRLSGPLCECALPSRGGDR